MHIAILEADTPVPEVQALYGQGYGDIFQSLLNRAAREVSSCLEPEYSVYNIHDDPHSYPTDFEKIDAILITGSRYSSFDDDEWIKRLCAYCLDVYNHHARIKLIGMIRQRTGGFFYTASS